MTSRLLFVDEQRLFCDAIAALLAAERGGVHDVEIVAVAADVAAAFAAGVDADAWVVALPREDRAGDALEPARAVLATDARVRVLVLAATSRSSVAVDALALGARGVVSRDDAVDALLDGAARVARGEVFVGPSFRPELVQGATRRAARARAAE